jgi:hypothetical protein
MKREEEKNKRSVDSIVRISRLLVFFLSYFDLSFSPFDLLEISRPYRGREMTKREAAITRPREKNVSIFFYTPTSLGKDPTSVIPGLPFFFASIYDTR